MMFRGRKPWERNSACALRKLRPNTALAQAGQDWDGDDVAGPVLPENRRRFTGGPAGAGKGPTSAGPTERLRQKRQRVAVFGSRILATAVPSFAFLSRRHDRPNNMMTILELAQKIVASANSRGYTGNGQLTVFSTILIF
jgi:hypothetical protein